MVDALAGFQPVYWINLDHHVQRQRRCAGEFDQHGVAHTRVAAVNGAGGDLANYLVGQAHPQMSPGEIGCYLSHMKAIDTFLEHSDSDYAVICEDDLSLELTAYWPFTFAELLVRIPQDWEILQLAVTSGSLPRTVRMNVHEHTFYEWGTVCYLIRRSYATRLLAKFKEGDRYRLDELACPKPVADLVLYSQGRSFTFPCLCPEMDDDPEAVNQRHFEMHKASAEMVRCFWKEYARQIAPHRLWDPLDTLVVRTDHKLIVRRDRGQHALPLADTPPPR